jgi:hypothetical protein
MERLSISPDAVENRKGLSPRASAGAWSLAILAFGLLFLAFEGGHPRTNWYYPFVVLLAIAVGIGAYRSASSESIRVVKPPLAAFISAASGATLYAGILSAFKLLLNATTIAWALIIFLPLGMAIESYRAERGKKRSYWPMIFAASLMVLTGLIIRLPRR